ncbi:MAG: hypothetical protein HY962_13030 [Ignavibacteriae bacterium]|nr:hypothetical protein [Ignavibacteriota bacterium]
MKRKSRSTWMGYGRQAAVAMSIPPCRCTTRSRKILDFKHYCTDAPI